MTISIVHDSQQGNGRQIAEKMGSRFESLGATVTIAHQSETSPESIVAQSPDLLVIGAAIRKFMTGPATKRWLSRLAKATQVSGPIPRGAFFITHMMPLEMADRRAQKFIGTVKEYGAVGDFHSEWFSGQVKKMLGPLMEGTLDGAEAHARLLFEWAKAE